MKRNILFICGISCSMVSYSNPLNDNSEKMNVLLLLVDDLRWNSLKCMGTEYLITPNIDNLAADGVIFENAYATTAISCVSRASILTGQYMSKHNVTNFGGEISVDAYTNTYPSVLRQNGYWVGHVGKYGVGKIRPEEYDFSSIYEGVHWYPVDPKVKIKKIGNGYTKIDGDSIHVTQRNIKDALSFLDARPKDRPFCLSVGFFATHAEDAHPQQYRYQNESKDFYKDIDLPIPYSANEDCLKKLPYFLQDSRNEGRIRWKWRFDTEAKYQEMMKSYYRLLTEVDTGIGRIIKRLKDEGIYENTLIIFMGDNGYFHGEHLLADKWYPYEESIRIPLIIHDPRIKKNKRNIREKSIALNIDIAPTIISAANGLIPKCMQGENLSDLYLSTKKIKEKWRTKFYYEHPVISNEKRIPTSKAVVSLNEKYIYWPAYNVEEYFNLVKDPYEIDNLINNIDFQDNINNLRIEMKVLYNKVKE